MTFQKVGSSLLNIVNMIILLFCTSSTYFQCLQFLLSKIYFSSNDMLKEIFQVDILKPNINLVNVVILLIYLLISFSVLIHTKQKKTNLLMAQTMKKYHQSKE